MADDDGATPRELILEACRRNNTDLLNETLATIKPSSSSAAAAAPAADSTTPTEAAIAALLNNVTDALGNSPLHVAATAGSLEVLDILLDQPGVETDPRDRMDGDTPLHRAVRFVNNLGEDEKDAAARTAAWAEGLPVVEILVDAGCDPRIRNKAKLRPVDVADVRNDELRAFLRRAEMLVVQGDDVVDESNDDDDAAGEGSGSETE